MKARWVLALALCQSIARPAPGQSPPGPYPHFRIRRLTGELVEGRLGSVVDSTFTGRLSSGELVRIPLREILDLEVATGTEAGTYAHVGGGLGLALGALAAVSVWADPTMEMELTEAAAAVVATGVAGAFLGAVVGARSPRWKRIPIHGPSPGPGGSGNPLIERRSPCPSPHPLPEAPEGAIHLAPESPSCCRRQAPWPSSRSGARRSSTAEARMWSSPAPPRRPPSPWTECAGAARPWW